MTDSCLFITEVCYICRNKYQHPMSCNRTYPAKGYHLPHKNILVLTCIDLRLMDEVTMFMANDNLTNRYDQFILAGTSLGTQFGPFKSDFNKKAVDKYKLDSFNHWGDMLFQHIRLAIALHQIEDVYIIEHRGCGAYKTFLNAEEGYVKNEEKLHRKYSKNLARQIKDEKEFEHLHIHCFLMDLRGNVEFLHSTNPDKENK